MENSRDSHDWSGTLRRDIDRINEQVTAISDRLDQTARVDLGDAISRLAVLEANFTHMKEQMLNLSEESRRDRASDQKIYATKESQRIPNALALGVATLIFTAFMWFLIAKVFQGGIPPHVP